MRNGNKVRSLAGLYAWPAVLGMLALGLSVALVGQAFVAGWSVDEVVVAAAVWLGCSVLVGVIVLLARRRHDSGADRAFDTAGLDGRNESTITGDTEMAARATVGLFLEIEASPAPVVYPANPVVHPSQRVLGSTASYVVPMTGQQLRDAIRRAVGRSNSLVLSNIDDQDAHIGRRTTLHYGVVWIVIEFASFPPGGTTINARSRSYADLGGGASELATILKNIKLEIDLATVKTSHLLVLGMQDTISSPPPVGNRSSH